MIITLLACVLFYLLGYWAGKSKDVLSDIKGVKLPEIKQVMPTGVIPPKTAKDLEKKNMDPIKKGGLEAMKETLDNTPEIAEHRRLVEQYKGIDKVRGIYDS